jgi:MFS family permease
VTEEVPKKRRVAIDLSPLRVSARFRILFLGHFVAQMGAQSAVIVVAWQVKELTGSPAAVGLIGAVELVPLLCLSLFGGALADAVDRRKVLLICDSGQLVVAALLLLNAHLTHPNLVAVYVLAALVAAFSSLGQPSLWAITPRLVGEAYYPAAAALESSSFSLAAIIGPTIGGLLIAIGHGAVWAYLFTVVTYVASLGSLVMLGPVPPSPSAPQPGVRAIADGFRYLKGKPVLQGTYILDFIAMVFGMPRALFPFFADVFGGDKYLGFLYAAPALGALVASVLSGWTGHVRRHGLAVVLSVVAWGAAVFLFGISPNIWWAVLFLALAGGADLVSVIFRRTIWNTLITDEYRGRLGGIAWANVRTGPVIGDVESGVVARYTSVRFSAASGGILCVAGAVLAAFLLPAFTRYRWDPGADPAYDTTNEPAPA